MPFDRRLVLVLLLAAGAALVVAGRVLPRPAAPAADLAPVVSVSAGAPAAAGAGATASGPVVVHVVGAVRHPGVYRLPAGSRTRDAVRRAGGAGRRADLGSVNLATRLADGEQVRVPRRAPPGAASAGASAGALPAAIVHLNSASADELDALDGIGPSLAQRIVDYRDAHGGFGSIDELDEVSGIGPVRLEALRPRLAL
ncbi:MAG TPA: helix-hairpin-helix domain-containing protein [Gaiellales bacterium]|jgi:competence protein ComEA|nr:helix-hairpin-helix domain-containing protein [Gaiellales bacterium]